MKAVCFIGAMTLLLPGCVEEPSPKETEQAAIVTEKNAEQDELKKKQLSIEQAAEEATKLIEADAKAEDDAFTDE